MYHSIGNTFIHVRHIFNSHIAKLSMLLSKFQIFEFAFWDIENSLSNWICTSYDFLAKKKNLHCILKADFLAFILALRPLFINKYYTQAKH